MLHRVLNSLILSPDRYAYQTAADLGLWAKQVVFPNARGQDLAGLFCHLPASDAATPPPHPVIIFCPGVSGNLSSHLHYVELLCRAGCRVFCFDYTGFGRSTGSPSLRSLVSDVLAASTFLHTTEHIEHLGLFGLSIGANAALVAATRQPSLIRAVAVEGLASQQDIIHGMLTQGTMGPRSLTTLAYNGKPLATRPVHVIITPRLPPWLATVTARLATATIPFEGKAPQKYVQALTQTPVFFIHGAEDPLLPCETTLHLYAAKPGPKRLWLIPHTGHAQEPALTQDAEYAAQLLNFFTTALPGLLPGSDAWPSPTCEVQPQASSTFSVTLRNPGPPGLMLITVVRDTDIDFHTRWVRDYAHIADLHSVTPPIVTCLRLFVVAGCEETAHQQLTPRGERYRTVFQPHIRALSQLLHEGRLRDFPALLQTLPEDKPEAPFDFFLGVYCLHIVQKTRRRHPHIARAAATAFLRYWPYSLADNQPPRSSIQHLVSTVLGASPASDTHRWEMTRP